MQISDTQIISPTIVNETRFQYIRDSDNQIPLSIDPTLIVQGAFTGGGSSQGNVDQQSGPLRAAELHLDRARQALHQVRRTAAWDAVLQHENSGFNGAYNFSSLERVPDHGERTAEGLDAGADSRDGRRRQPVLRWSPGSRCPMSRWSTSGCTREDEWRIRPNISLSYGLRYETQTGIPYEGDWAPRVSLAWGLGHSKTPEDGAARAATESSTTASPTTTCCRPSATTA